MVKKTLFARRIHGYWYLLLLMPFLLFYFYSTRREANSTERSSKLFMKLLDGDSVASELSTQPNAYGLMMKVLNVINRCNSDQQLDAQELEIIHRNPQLKSSVAVATLGRLMSDYCRKRRSPWTKMMDFLTILDCQGEASLGEFPFYNPNLLGSISDIKEELIDGTANQCTKNGTG